MTATAERVLQDIKRLPAADLRELWRLVSQLVVEKNSPPLSPAPQVSDEEFAAALDEVTGCTAGSHSLDRLLEERRQDLAQEQAGLDARARERARG